MKMRQSHTARGLYTLLSLGMLYAVYSYMQHGYTEASRPVYFSPVDMSEPVVITSQASIADAIILGQTFDTSITFRVMVVVTLIFFVVGATTFEFYKIKRQSQHT